MNYDLIFHVDSRDDFDMKLALSEAANYRNESVRQDRRVEPDDIIAIGSSSSSLMPIPFSIVFVINGPAVKFINRDNTDLMERAQEAYDNGVQFFAGEYAMKTYGVEKEDIWPFVETVPSAILKIVQLEHQGYSYVKP